jgi:hypothetical protein
MLIKPQTAGVEKSFFKPFLPFQKQRKSSMQQSSMKTLVSSIFGQKMNCLIRIDDQNLYISDGKLLNLDS